MIPIIFGIIGKKSAQEEIDLFTVPEAAGFTLFSRYVESKKQILELTAGFKGLYTEREVPIFVEQEGGRVARIKPRLLLGYSYQPSIFTAFIMTMDQ